MESCRGRQQDASERQGQPGEDIKAGTSAPGGTVAASVADSEDAYSDAYNSSSSVQSEDVSSQPLIRGMLEVVMLMASGAGFV